MGLLFKTAAFLSERQWNRWQNFAVRPEEIQNKRLLQMIAANRRTSFGRDHRFHEIRSLSDYRQRVVVGDYERLRPYVQRAADGESDVLTSKPVLMFALTSGSTGQPKLIPVTASSRRNHRQITRLWYHRAANDHPELFSGKLLGAVSPADEGRTSAGIPFGAASGLIYRSSPSWIQNAFAVPYKVAAVENFAAKYYLTVRLALEHDVTFVGTPNPSTILKLIETVNRRKAELIRDICDGTIDPDCDAPAKLKRALGRRLRKNPARARRLESLIKYDGTLRPKEYWPRLQLIGCWKGGTVGIRLQEFSRWFGRTPVRDLGYMASEAQMTLPISDDGSAGILAIAENFYEFIPESEMGSPSPVVLTCAELEEGGTYYVVVTTPGGLYRYDINDIVRVTGFHKRTPLLEFVRKGRDVTNITGEKLHVNQVIEAMQAAQSAAAVTVQHFRACADVERSRYAFAVEMNGSPPDEARLSRILLALDMSLRKLNVEYAQKRESGRLAPPILWVMKPGWFERRAAAALKSGARDAQSKSSLLVSVPEDADDIERVVHWMEVHAAGSV